MVTRTWYSDLQFIARLLAVLLLCFGCAVAIVEADDDDDDIREIVVKLNPDADVTIEEINADYGTTTVSVVLSSRRIYLLRIPDDEDEAEDLAADMAADPRVLYAEPNFRSDIPEGDGNYTWEWGGPDDAPREGQYAANMLQLAAVQGFTQGAGTVVAVLDSGLQLDHPALLNRLTTDRYDFIDDDTIPADEGNGIDDDGDGAVDEAVGHGTHVAGIVLLVAPEAQLMPVRVLDGDGRGDIFRVAEGILYAAEHGAGVINLSLGTPEESDLLEDVLEDVRNQYNVVVVAAAGNLNSTSPQYPAADDGVLAVTALDADDRRAEFANYGDWIDIAAPGVSIYSTLPVDGYAWWSGTSMATPFVAGQAALLRSILPDLSAAVVAQSIQTTAQPVGNINPEYAGLLGAGRIDVLAAVTAACASSICEEDENDVLSQNLFLPITVR